MSYSRRISLRLTEVVCIIFKKIVSTSIVMQTTVQFEALISSNIVNLKNPKKRQMAATTIATKTSSNNEQKKQQEQQHPPLSMSRSVE
ncbi:MAG: hypothetical protein ACJ70X_06025 [Nitrososphaera sp.]